MVWLRVTGSLHYGREAVPIARCAACRGRFRVLPVELLPYKVYSLAVIETAVGRYTGSCAAGTGLRKVVARFGPGHPHFSILHGWLGGLGERILHRAPHRPGMAPKHASRRKTSSSPLGRLGALSAVEGSLPTSALVAESAKRLTADLNSLWHRRFPIARWKYKSEHRRDQLEACARVMAAARSLFPRGPHPLTAWQGWLIDRLHVTGWTFFSRARCTPIQLTPPPESLIRSSASPDRRKGGSRHGPRSPPDRMVEI